MVKSPACLDLESARGVGDAMLLRRSFGVVLALVGSSSAAGCWFFGPTSLDGMGEANIRAQCHFAFACCTAPERSAYYGLGAYRDEATCVEVTLEDGNYSHLLAARAKAVVGAGNGEFDGQRADECTRPMLDALNSCDADAVLGGANVLDPLCGADAGRMFVVGKLADGEDCTDDLECAGYGTCVVEDPPENTITIAGQCRASRAEGEVCFDPTATEPEYFNCVPGTSCVSGDPGESSTCQTSAGADNGEPCFNHFECDSAYCDQAALVCEEQPSVTVEVCDGA